jgi:hypothetical protein
MVLKENYSGSINGIMKCILVTSLEVCYFLSLYFHAYISRVNCLGCGGAFIPVVVVCRYLVYLYLLLVYWLSVC